MSGAVQNPIPLPIARGGTGAITAAAARTALGVPSGTGSASGTNTGDQTLPFVRSFFVASVALLTASGKTWWIGSANTPTTGQSFGRDCVIDRLTLCGNVSALAGATAVKATLWNANQTAGSEIIAATSPAPVLNTGLDGWASNVIVNSGKNVLPAGTKFLLSIEAVGGTSVTVQVVNVDIEGHWTS